jgi:MFS family permease
MAMLSYVAIYTNEEERTTRIAIAEGMFSVGVLVSFFTGGVILDNTSYVFVFSVALVLQLIAIMWVVFIVKDKLGPVTKQEGKEVDVPDKDGDKNMFKAQVKKFVEAAKSIFRKRPRNARVHLLIVLPMMLFIMLGGIRRSTLV